MASLRWTVMETLNAECHRKAADEATENADALKHWKMCPRTPEERAEVAEARRRWEEAQAVADGLRRRQNASAYEAATELLRANRQFRAKARKGRA